MQQYVVFAANMFTNLYYVNVKWEFSLGEVDGNNTFLMQNISLLLIFESHIDFVNEIRFRRNKTANESNTVMTE